MKSAADKEEIVPILFKFFVDNGVSIQGGLTKKTMWKFYRDLKLFEFAFTSVYGRVSLRGIGRYKMTTVRRAESERLSPRLFAGKSIDRYFKDNPQDGVTFFDQDEPKMKLRERVFHILKKLRGERVISYDNI